MAMQRPNSERNDAPTDLAGGARPNFLEKNICRKKPTNEHREKQKQTGKNAENPHHHSSGDHSSRCLYVHGTHRLA